MLRIKGWKMIFQAYANQIKQNSEKPKTTKGTKMTISLSQKEVKSTPKIELLWTVGSLIAELGGIQGRS